MHKWRIIMIVKRIAIVKADATGATAITIEDSVTAEHTSAIAVGRWAAKIRAATEQVGRKITSAVTARVISPAMSKAEASRAAAISDVLTRLHTIEVLA